MKPVPPEVLALVSKWFKVVCDDITNEPDDVVVNHALSTFLATYIGQWVRSQRSTASAIATMERVLTLVEEGFQTGVLLFNERTGEHLELLPPEMRMPPSAHRPMGAPRRRPRRQPV